MGRHQHYTTTPEATMKEVIIRSGFLEVHQSVSLLHCKIKENNTICLTNICAAEKMDRGYNCDALGSVV
jgi:hypothetical protein